MFILEIARDNKRFDILNNVVHSISTLSWTLYMIIHITVDKFSTINLHIHIINVIGIFIDFVMIFTNKLKSCKISRPSFA